MVTEFDFSLPIPSTLDFQVDITITVHIQKVILNKTYVFFIIILLLWYIPNDGEKCKNVNKIKMKTQTFKSFTTLVICIDISQAAGGSKVSRTKRSSGAFSVSTRSIFKSVLIQL